MRKQDVLDSKDSILLNRHEALQAAKFKCGKPILVRDVYKENLDNEESMEEIEHYVLMDLGVPYQSCMNRYIVSICNYKGEQEDFMFVEDAEELPTFTTRTCAEQLFLN